MTRQTGDFDALRAAEIVHTAERLSARVHARFPGRGLDQVGNDLVLLVRQADADAEAIARPRWPIRLASATLAALVLAAFVAGIVLAFRDAVDDFGDLRSFDWIAIAESAINDIVFGGIAIFFVISIERRRKRSAALRALHRLRSFAHVIDMHQLTKDPERVIGSTPATAQSPEVGLSRDELGRYLDYCSEMLSLLAKVAAVYAEATDDGQVLATVNEIETLTISLSRKIWQKISLLYGQRGRPSEVRA